MKESHLLLEGQGSTLNDQMAVCRVCRPDLGFSICDSHEYFTRSLAVAQSTVGPSAFHLGTQPREARLRNPRSLSSLVAVDAVSLIVGRRDNRA